MPKSLTPKERGWKIDEENGMVWYISMLCNKKFSPSGIDGDFDQ